MNENKEIEEMARDLNSSLAEMSTESFSDCLEISRYLVGLGYRNVKDKVHSRREWYQIGYKDARKETAREILQTIKSYDGWNELQRLRDEIAEEYGVEVEE